jgi:excisionase family DNA binding protein
MQHDLSVLEPVCKEEGVSAGRRGVAMKRERRDAGDERLLDVREAAALLGLKSPRTLYKWAYSGRVPSVKIGRLLRFHRADVERLIAQGHRAAFESSASGR